MMSHTLRKLDFCQLYTVSTGVMGRFTYIPIVFVKTINMTQALNPTDSTAYSGLWTPTFSSISFSDEDYYIEYGYYLRYTSSLTILQVMFDERPFYIKNIEQPIVRTAELIFHCLLFTSLCIELFAFAFLFVKLFIIPICRCLKHLWNKTIHRNVNRKINRIQDEYDFTIDIELDSIQTITDF
ncbi:hypothetical protein I4U23_000164 [Adineta vaga]|nr:hypothetical protein I4U23_000164 [Adineta vaga]